MIHPDTELTFISDDIGYGVVAKKFIPKGTITWVMDKLDRIFTPQEILGLESAYQQILNKYTFRDNAGNYILCWDHGRFVNHSFRPTCMTTAYNYELAIRDIYPGDELTNDYGTLNLTSPFDCLMEKGCARKSVMPDDIVRQYPSWDKKLKSAYKRFNKVDQPMAHLLSEQVLSMSVEIGKGTVCMDSILSCYCPNLDDGLFEGCYS